MLPKKNKKLLKYIAAKSKEFRKDKNITVRDFMDTTGVHISRIEQADRDISVSTLSKICKELNISMSEFLKEYDG